MKCAHPTTGTQKSPKYDYDREDISGFDIIENSKNGKTYEYQIANDKVNGNRLIHINNYLKCKWINCSNTKIQIG